MVNNILSIQTDLIWGSFTDTPEQIGPKYPYIKAKTTSKNN